MEISKQEYDRLKSREEKLLAYYERRKEGEGMELNSIEEVINDNIRLREKYKKQKDLLDITVQTKNEYIRNLLEELEYYKKQCGKD